jgi:hypothetical protein
MPVTRHPLDRSVRAALPHSAPALGRDDQTLVRVRVADAWGRQPVGNELVHVLPAQVFGLAAVAHWLRHGGSPRCKSTIGFEMIQSSNPWRLSVVPMMDWTEC